jgi:uncharacterized protein (TIGR02271 family)
MARAPLRDLDDWQLVHEDQDLRGQTLFAPDGTAAGRVDQMIVDTDTERVVALRLEDGREVPTSAIELRDGSDGRERGAFLLPERAAGDEQVFPIVEERLRIAKRTVPLGAVEIHTAVETEQRTVEVPLAREEVHVERRAVEPYPIEGELRPDGDTIRVPIMGEEAVVQKQPVVTGEVVVSKEQVTETEEVSASLRRTHVDVEREGAATVRGHSD